MKSIFRMMAIHIILYGCVQIINATKGYIPIILNMQKGTKMARKLHKSLDYEKRSIAHSKYQIRSISDILYKIQGKFGKEFVNTSVWTYGRGMTFRDTNEIQYAWIKNILPRLSKLNKESNQYGLSLFGHCCETEILNQRVRLQVKFTWDVPDTCEIKTNTTDVKVGDNYFVGDDGNIYCKKTEKEVVCTKPILKSVFNEKEKTNA